MHEDPVTPDPDCPFQDLGMAEHAIFNLLARGTLHIA